MLSLILLLLFCVVTNGQSAQCTLKIADLPATPELAGFHLGMTKEQVKLHVPQVEFGKTDEFGVSKTTINPFFDPRIDKTPFTGMRSVSLDFLDDRLMSLWIGYDSTFKANTIDDFITLVSHSLHLPDAWTSWRSRGRQMRCGDFQLTVTTVADGPSFRIVDATAEDLVIQRRAIKAESEDSPPLSQLTKPVKLPAGR